jgi:hypothetical protein
MGFESNITIGCDNCQKKEDAMGNAEKVRSDLRKNGWHIGHKHVYCPTCAPLMDEENNAWTGIPRRAIIAYIEANDSDPNAVRESIRAGMETVLPDSPAEAETPKKSKKNRKA